MFLTFNVLPFFQRKPSLSLTVNDGVFSTFKGLSPKYSLPLLLSLTFLINQNVWKESRTKSVNKCLRKVCDEYKGTRLTMAGGMEVRS